jgi:hypothetical protein
MVNWLYMLTHKARIMKKLIFGGLFLLPFCSFGQTEKMIVTDMESKITYLTELVVEGGNVGFLISDSRIIEDDAANQIGGKLYNGPAERTTFPTSGEVTVIKTCLNTNIWPCMYVRQQR